jgi:hypothetical protein
MHTHSNRRRLRCTAHARLPRRRWTHVLSSSESAPIEARSLSPGVVPFPRADADLSTRRCFPKSQSRFASVLLLASAPRMALRIPLRLTGVTLWAKSRTLSRPWTATSPCCSAVHSMRKSSSTMLPTTINYLTRPQKSISSLAPDMVSPGTEEGLKMVTVSCLSDLAFSVPVEILGQARPTLLRASHTTTRTQKPFPRASLHSSPNATPPRAAVTDYVIAAPALAVSSNKTGLALDITSRIMLLLQVRRRLQVEAGVGQLWSVLAGCEATRARRV